MCPFDPPEDLNAQREAIVALWHRERALVAENEELRRKLAEADKKKGAGKGKKNKSERRGRTGHVPPPAQDGPPQKGHGPTDQPHLPEVERELDVDEGDRTCKLCGGDLEEAPELDETAELIDVIERQFVRVQARRKMRRCRCGGCLELAHAPDKVLVGGRYSLNFAVEVAHDKYLLHSPLERQAREMTRQGLVIDSQTLWDQLWGLGQLVEPAYHTLHRHVLSGPWVHADETTWQLLGHQYLPSEVKAGEWYVWVAHRPGAAFYLIQPQRDEHGARELLTVPELDASGKAKRDEAKKLIGALYEGKVVCDAWWAYQYLVGKGARWVLVHCWAHVRREFIASEKGFPVESAQMLSWIGELYAIESRVPQGSEHDEERQQLRQTESKAVLEKIAAWVNKMDGKFPSGSSLQGALTYVKNQWEGLTQFVDDARLPLDNNAAEQDCRQPVLGKKNHQGSRSERGLQVAGMFYTLVQSAKLSGVEPKTYLRLAATRALRGWPVVLPHEVTEQELRDTLGLSEAEAGRVLARRPPPRE